jgi:hypothetical protein
MGKSRKLTASPRARKSKPRAIPKTTTPKGIRLETGSFAVTLAAAPLTVDSIDQPKRK